MLKRLRTYGYAAASEGVLALCAFGVLFALGARHDREVVSVYLLIRRVVAVLVPAITLGMPLALIRNLVLCRGGGSRLIAVATLTVLAGIIALSTLSGVAGATFTQFGLGARGYEGYAWLIVVTALGVALTTIAVGALRGRERITAGATMMIVNLGALPLLFALIAPELWMFLILVGGSQSVISLIVLARDLLSRWPPEPVRVRDFMSFGAKATTAELSLMVLLWLPPATISRSESIADSGYFSLILSMVILLASPIAPVATSIMPRISAAVARQDGAALRRIVLLIAGVAVAGGAAMVALGSVLYDVVARQVLGNGGSLEPGAALLMLSAVVPFTVIFGLRGAIDVVWSPLHNAAILSGGTGIFVVIYLGAQHWVETTARLGVVMGFTLAVWAMALCTVWHGILIIRMWRTPPDAPVV